MPRATRSPAANQFELLGGSDDEELARSLQGKLDLGVGRGARERSASPKRTGGRQDPLLRGRVPNVHWRATSLDELRAHDHFRALPPVDDVHVGGPRTFAYVRQDDPLWSELHAGVITSRHLLGALGLCEPRAAAELGLSPAMAGHGQALGAWASLCGEAEEGVTWQADAARAVDAEEDALLAALNEEAIDAFNAATRKARATERALVGRPRGGSARARRGLGSGCSISAVRCAWGSAQEASTLRSAVEQLEPGACLAEAGLSMLDVTTLPPVIAERVRGAALPPIGASPDAMLRRADGQLETVEVKNVCPFVKDRKRPGGFCVWRGAHDGEPSSTLGRGPHAQLLSTHVPQVQLEMLCARCRAGRLLSASACFGINEFRMERDDEYLSLLLHFLGLFYNRYVRTRTPPPEDFFRGEADGELYLRLLARTAELARRATLVRHIAQPWRVDGDDDAFFIAN